jgi:mannose-1-phosphate guanylyltransferase
LVAVVLAGGSGTRLWPRSRAGAPKHLSTPAPDGRSLLRHAFDRAARLGGELLVVTAAEQAAQVLAELPELEPDRLLLEPEPHGTGPALTWAAIRALELRPDAVVVSLHADHFMPNISATTLALLSAASWARVSPVLISIGLKPTWAAPGFGYVEAGTEIPRPPHLGRALPLLHGRGFVEKPGPDRALQLVAGGNSFWNTGLFAWRAELFLQEMETYAPEVARSVADALASSDQGSSAFAEAWAKVPRGVVERLLLERSPKLAVLPVDLPWSDLGSFLDLYQAAIAAGRGDARDNVVSGDALLLDSAGNYVDAAAKRLVVVLGGEGLVVVDTEDALLVCPLSRVQEVAKVVAEVRSRGRLDLL